MPTLHQRTPQTALLLLAISLMILTAGCSSKSLPKAGIFELDDNTVIVKGVAAKVTEQYLTVEYSLQDQIRLETSDDMILKGFPSLWAIETDQPLKINYRIEGNKNIIVSITRIPRLGC